MYKHYFTMVSLVSVLIREIFIIAHHGEAPDTSTVKTFTRFKIINQNMFEMSLTLIMFQWLLLVLKCNKSGKDRSLR